MISLNDYHKDDGVLNTLPYLLKLFIKRVSTISLTDKQFV